MNTINIKGKEYVPVSERVVHFRKSQEYAGWTMETEIVRIEGNDVLIKAIIKDNEGRIRATGHASENQTMGNINKTSYIENCETSAWGRALANLGIGVMSDIASADEIQSAADKNEKLKEKVSKDNIAALKMRAEAKGSDMDMILSYCGVECVDDMTFGQYVNIMKMLEKKEGQKR